MRDFTIEFLQCAKFHIGTFGKLSIVAAYAPTQQASDHEKDEFYTRLDQAMTLTHRSKLLCLGDFNAVSGSDRSMNSTVVGPFELEHRMITPNVCLTSASATTSVSMALGSKEVTVIATHGTLTTAVLPRRSTMSSPIHGGKLFSSAECTAAWSLTPTTEQ